MREIKLRGKRADNGEWVYGSLMVFNEATCIMPLQEQDSPADLHFFEVDPATVGEYTGLKDKNGVEIYEGDILLREWDGMSQHSQPPEGNIHLYDYYTVEWKKQGFNFRNRRVEVQNFNGKPWMTYEYDNPMMFHSWLNDEPKIDNLEVIGNIYDNPELLEASR